MATPAWYNPTRIVHNNFSFVRIHDVHIDIEDAHELFEWYHAKNLSLDTVKCHQETEAFVYDLEEYIHIGPDIMHIFTRDMNRRPLESLELVFLDLEHGAKDMLRDAFKQNESIHTFKCSLEDMILHVAEIVLENTAIDNLYVRGNHSHMDLEELTELVNALNATNNILYLDISENQWQLEHVPQLTALVEHTQSISELVMYQPEEFFCCHTADEIIRFASALVANETIEKIHLTSDYTDEVKYILYQVQSIRNQSENTSSKTLNDAKIILNRFVNRGSLLTDPVNIIKSLIGNRRPLDIIPALD